MNIHSLQELVALVEDEISRYMSQREEYSERLGDLLRGSKEEHGSEDWFKGVSLGESLLGGRSRTKKKGKGAASEEWVPFQGVFLSSSVQGEAELMFKAIEAITAKIEGLNETKTAIEELRNVGLGDEVSYIVLLREGIPERIVIKPAGDDAIKRFTFDRVFSVFRRLQQ